MTDKGEGMQADAGNAEVIEGFYDWGPGVVVTADCLGQSYQTSLAGRPLIVKMPVFDGTAIVEPAPRYKRPESYVDVVLRSTTKERQRRRRHRGTSS